ncbi:receptor [Branchiostoma belcheri]|nr:receptor [Branchiostoma belcheri]
MSLNESLQFEFGKNTTLNESLQFSSDFLNNGTLKNATEEGTPDQAAMRIVVPAAFSLICLVGISGNALVIYLVWRHKEMRTVTNFYIVNLAVTDLAFLVCCVPFSAVKLTTESWTFGEFLCKSVFYFMQGELHRLWRDHVGIRPRYAGRGASASRASFTASGGTTSAFGRDTLGGGHQQAGR